MNLKNYSDIKLIELMKGNRKSRDEAFKEIYLRYSRLIHGFISTYIKDSDAAEDIFQDTFIKFFDVAQKKEIQNIQAYLLTLSKNLCLNYIRTKKRNIEIDESMLCENDDKIGKNEMIELILSSMDLLEPLYKECFMMREFEGLSYNEIGEKLGITADNAKVRTLRAKRKIIEILQPYLKDLSK